MSFDIPTLETARLILRAFRNDDLDAFAAMSADAEVMRYIGRGDTLDRNAAWRNMAGFNGHWTLKGCGMWAIERKSDGAFLGRVGLHHPPYWPALEAGWTLGPGLRTRRRARRARLCAPHAAAATARQFYSARQRALGEGGARVGRAARRAERSAGHAGRGLSA
jgi:hypothetical protein